MRILILGNLANDGYAIAKELRKLGKDVELGVNISDFGMALPEWEDGYISDTTDPYSFKKDSIIEWKPPKWIRYFDLYNKLPKTPSSMFKKLKSRISLLKLTREYDVIQSHVPFAIYAQFARRKHIVYDAGWIRYFPYRDTFRDKLARRAYKNANIIIFTNPDTISIFENLNYIDKTKLRFVPFAIDHNKYKPINVKEQRSKYVKEDELLLFSPTRQIWSEKGNDKIIKAFAKFVKYYPNSKLMLVEWSIDKEKSKKLINSLHLDEEIIWIKPVPKNKLIELYNVADIILDQFVIGSWGTATPEAMACAKPVLMYYNPDYISRYFSEMPPILNSYSIDDIYNNLIRLSKDEDFRIKIGKKSREWCIKTHSGEVVARKHIAILDSLFS